MTNPIPVVTELEPCPYCGSTDIFTERADFSSSYGVCNNCLARGPVCCQDGDDEEEPGQASAKRSWNQRSPTRGEVERAYAHAVRLAKVLHEKHYGNPEWRPLPDLLGVIDQIDNMTTGLIRPQGEALSALEDTPQNQELNPATRASPGAAKASPPFGEYRG